VAEIVAWSEICVPRQTNSKKGGIRSLKLLDGCFERTRPCFARAGEGLCCRRGVGQRCEQIGVFRHAGEEKF